MKKVLFVLLLISFSAGARTIKMVQAGKTFLGDITDAQASQAYDDPEIEEKYKVESLVLAPGDKIRFINRDEVAHNVSGTKTDKVVFDVKIQEPGVKNDREIELKEKGEITVQCAIHPKMKLKIKVE